MLNKLRGPQAKRILWILAVVIVAAFGLSGAGFYLAGRDKNTLGTIGGKKISANELQKAIGMAQLQILLAENKPPKLSRLDFQRLGLDLLVLLWKADQETIKVTNQEVKAHIVNNLFSQRKFDQENYENFIKTLSQRYGLGLNARNFEEYIRSFIKIDKLFQKYTKVEVKPEEVKELYLRDTQKAKIAYLAVGYENFKVDVGISPSEVERFYLDNQALFEKEPKVNIAYLLIENNNPLLQQIIESLEGIKTLKDLSEKFSLSIKETGLIGLSEPIEEIGWQYQITQIAFSLDKNTLSPPLETEKGILIIEKIDQQTSFVPLLSDIEQEVKQALILDQAKKQAKRFSQELLEKIQTEGINNLKKLASKKNIEYSQTEYFKFNDYIEGLGLDVEISSAAFSLKTNEISQQLFARQDAVYIIQLKELTPIDDKDFQEKQSSYQNLITRNKLLTKRMQFLERVKQEADLSLNLPNNPQQ